MKRAVAVVMAITSFVAAPSAAAKGPSTLLVCGPRGCLRTRDRAALDGFNRYLHGQSPRRGSPARVGPYYELRGKLDHAITYGFFVPAADSFSV